MNKLSDASSVQIGDGSMAEPTVDHLKRRVLELESLLSRAGVARNPNETAELLSGVGPILVREHDLDKLVQSVTDIATRVLGADCGSFLHSNECTELLRHASLIRSDDIQRDPRYSQGSVQAGMPGRCISVRSYLAAPVVSRSGEVLGALVFGHPSPSQFTEQHEAIITGVAGQAAIAIDNAHLFEQAQWVQIELKRANEELRRANRDLETFAYSASHDLQEPLRNIALSAQLLTSHSGRDLDSQQKEFLQSILRGTERMEALMQDLLAYMQAIRCADGPAPRIAAEKVLFEVLETLNNRMEACSAKVTAAVLPVVAMHELHLRQLFQNLIGNALKYRGSEAPSIQISATQQDGWSVLSVTDNGIGIEARYSDQIFGLFKRLHSRDLYQGSGIGLAICQRIVEQYSGRIWLEKSAPGVGSTFCFAIPDQRSQ